MSALPDFSRDCEKVVLKLWGDPDRKTPKQYSWKGNGAYSCRTYDPRKHVWYDAGLGCGGSTLELIYVHRHGKPPPESGVRGKDFFACWRWGHEQGLIPDAPPDLRDRDHFNGLAVIRRHRYEDEDGQHLQDVCRLDTNDPDLKFRPQLPSGEWKAAKRQVLYRLPQLIAAPISELVAYTEGECDADTMARFGFASTTHAGGVFKYRKSFNKYFKDRDVVVCGDFDATHHKGEQNAGEIAAEITKVAKRVRVLIAPDGFKDMTEWVERGGGTAEAFRKLVDALPDFKTKPEEPAAAKAAGLEDEIALDFAAQHANDLRYVAARSQWMQWTGGRWQAEETLVAFDLSRALCRPAGDAKAKTVSAVVALARTDRRLAATVDQWDREPLQLNSPDGIIDLTDGTVTPNDPLAYCSKIAGCAPAPPGTPAPLWTQFLARVLVEPEKIAFLQRWCGYCLTADVSEHKFVFAHGGGGNGKTVFSDTVSGILGDYARTVSMEIFLAADWDRHPTEIAQLRGIRFAVAHEIGEERKWDEGKLKKLTGGDVLEARYMRGDFFNFAPSHKLMLLGNTKPSLRSGDEAMRRRLILLPFTVTVPERERDPELSDKLKAEWPAILRWMIDGSLQWQQQGLTPPPSVAAAGEEYMADQDTLALWLGEKTVSGNASDFTATADLFASWKEWCQANNEQPGRLQRFTEALQNHGYKSDRITLENGKRSRGFYGLRLIDMFKTEPGRG